MLKRAPVYTEFNVLIAEDFVAVGAVSIPIVTVQASVIFFIGVVLFKGMTEKDGQALEGL